MWCDHCQEDIVPVANKENNGIQECSQCGKHLSGLERTGTEVTQADQAGGSSVAQTAHALLKRWEANRPIAESSSATKPSAATEAITNGPAASVSENTVALKNASASLSSNKKLGKKTAPKNKPTFANEDIFDDIPSGLDVSEILPDLIPPMQAASQRNDLSKKLVSKPETSPEKQRQAEKTSAISSQLTSASKINPPETKATSTPSKAAQPKQTQHAGSTLASQNDAGSLLKQSPESIPQQNTKSPIPESPKQTGAVASPETQSEKPTMFKAKTKAKAKPQAPAPQPETSQGRVRFTPPEITDEKIDDLGIQQAIERHHRKQRNWSVLFAQLMVYGGALAMTCGIAIVIGNRFGSMDIAETTGWLTLAGGHLLFVLGIYTHLSSKMEQVWSEMHARHDELSRLLNQNMTTGSPRRTNTAAPASSSASFQRSSLSETIREVA